MPATFKTISVRPEQPADEAFLFELYASTRQEELDAWGWPADARKAFLTLQFKASQNHRVIFPDAEFQIVLLDKVNAGRLVVNRSREDMRIVDIALLPEYRNAGAGSALLQKVFGEAAASKKPLRLRVLKGNRAERLYRRLGFEKIGENEMHLEMEWRAAAPTPPKKQLSYALKLPLEFDAASLQSDLARLGTDSYVPHFNQAYYQGDWSAIALRSVGGHAGHIYPDPTAGDTFANTPLLASCPGVTRVLETLHCPQKSVRFLRLKAGSVIKEHSDLELDFEDGEVRLHIPVITNPDVEFILAGSRVVMREGECWYLNVSQPHSVNNRGATDRIHLVVDCVVNDWLRNMMLSTAGAKSAGR
jgi:ribosomal protein S18 acetylase RimI-like enzyme